MANIKTDKYKNRQIQLLLKTPTSFSVERVDKNNE